jgi:RNA polymerase sigma factor (sigma-70 family)
MHQFLNVDILAVKVPTHNQTRALIWDVASEKQGTMSDTGNSRLKQALSGSTTVYEEGDIASTLDQAQEYEDKEHASYMYSTALEKLTRKEFHIIKLRYYEDMSQEEVGEALGVTQQYISLYEALALSKLKTSFL